jgi:hypothetical protein
VSVVQVRRRRLPVATWRMLRPSVSDDSCCPCDWFCESTSQAVAVSLHNMWTYPLKKNMWTYNNDNIILSPSLKFNARWFFLTCLIVHLI